MNHFPLFCTLTILDTLTACSIPVIAEQELPTPSEQQISSFLPVPPTPPGPSRAPHHTPTPEPTIDWQAAAIDWQAFLDAIAAAEEPPQPTAMPTPEAPASTPAANEIEERLAALESVLSQHLYAHDEGAPDHTHSRYELPEHGHYDYGRKLDNHLMEHTTENFNRGWGFPDHTHPNDHSHGYGFGP